MCFKAYRGVSGGFRGFHGSLGIPWRFGVFHGVSNTWKRPGQVGFIDLLGYFYLISACFSSGCWASNNDASFSCIFGM